MTDMNCPNCGHAYARAALAAGLGGGWVSVADRLPEFDRGTGYVLVHASSGMVSSDLFASDPKFFCAHVPKGATGHFECEGKYGYIVTHWQPLPSAPSSAGVA